MDERTQQASRVDDGLRGAHGPRLGAPAAPLPVDRRVRRLQLPRARTRDRRCEPRRARAAAGRAGARHAGPASTRRRAPGLDQRPARPRGRGAPDARRPADRQAAARARARRAARRSPRVGSRRAVLPLPDQVDARAGSDGARDRSGDVLDLGVRARGSGAPRVHASAPSRRPQADVLEDEHRSDAAAGRGRWAITTRSTASSRASSSTRRRARSGLPRDPGSRRPPRTSRR